MNLCNLWFLLLEIIMSITLHINGRDEEVRATAADSCLLYTSDAADE